MKYAATRMFSSGMSWGTGTGLMLANRPAWKPRVFLRFLSVFPVPTLKETGDSNMTIGPRQFINCAILIRDLSHSTSSDLKLSGG